MNDKIQREQALDINNSYIVEAPAGSGKTELLTQRYLKLLAVCNKPENIIVTTFTNKAVAELKERVLTSLKLVGHKKPSEPHKKITYNLACKVIEHSYAKKWQLLKTPQRLKISTIDGLFSTIVKNSKSESQLIPYRIMAHQWEQERTYRLAAEQTLLMINDAEYYDYIAPLLLYFNNDVEKFYSLITHMLAKRDQWLTKLYKNDTLNPAVLKDSAKKIITSHLILLTQEAEKYIHEDFFEALQTNTKYKIEKLPSNYIEDLKIWQSIASLCLTKNGSWRKNIDKNSGFTTEFKEQKSKFKAILNELDERYLLKKLLIEVNILPDIDFKEEQITILNTISMVLKFAVAHLNLLFENEVAYDFIEVALRANKILAQNSNINDSALFLDYKIEHILIDEFQDTSYSQFNLIKKLINNWQPTDNKTLFLVGDPMQSIYRFRESQVGLFLQVKEFGIAGVHPKHLQLSMNFRSAKSIVDKNNTFFTSIFPQQEDIYKGAVSYCKTSASNSNTDNKAITFYPFYNNEYSLEAAKVLAIIKKNLAENKTDTIAVLARNRSHLVAIIKLLKDNNIDFEALKINNLKDNMFSRDLLSLTKALLNLGDKLAWLSILRAPWCGLLLADLLIMAADDKLTTYQKLADKKTLNKLSKDGQKRVFHLKQCLLDSIDNKGGFNFTELVAHAIKKLYPANSLSQTKLIIKQQFLQIINTCEQMQLLDATTINNSLAELYIPTTDAKIKLMTIHQAKGLEFDTVIIPGLGRKPRFSDSPIIHIKEFANQSLLIAPIKSPAVNLDSNTYNYLKYIDSWQNKFETMRLLYVAMTRTKKKLHLLGSVNTSKKITDNSLLKLLMPLPFFKHSFDNMKVTKSSEADTTVAPKLKRFSLQQDTNNKLNVEKISLEKKYFIYKDNFELLFKSILGTLIHKYYEQHLFKPSKSNIKARLIAAGMPPNKLNEYTKKIIQLLINTQKDHNFNWLFKPRKSTLVEAEFSSFSDSNIIIDRLFIDKNILWIIDFKTSSPLKNENLSAFISRQQLQYKEQLLIYKKVLSNIYTNEIKCALYYPAIPQLILLPS